jgi:hypothetical protein
MVLEVEQAGQVGQGRPIHRDAVVVVVGDRVGQIGREAGGQVRTRWP